MSVFITESQHWGWIIGGGMDERIYDEIMSEVYESTIINLTIIFLSIVASFYIIYKFRNQFQQEVSSWSDNVGNGLLHHTMDESKNDEYTTVRKSLNKVTAKLSHSIQEIKLAIDSQIETTNSVSNRTENTRDIIKSHVAETSRTAESINEFSLSVKEISDNIHQTASLADNTLSLASAAQTTVSAMATESESLKAQFRQVDEEINSNNNSVQQIHSALEVIGSIAEQTNLLALNAAIEAARAGDQGRGFAVVADEVRALASRTQNSTTEISSFLEELVANSQSITTMVGDMNQTCEQVFSHSYDVDEALNKLIESAKTSNQYSESIAAAAEQQTMIAIDAAKAINSISQKASEIEGHSESIRETMKAQQSNTAMLEDVIAQLNVNQQYR